MARRLAKELEFADPLFYEEPVRPDYNRWLPEIAAITHGASFSVDDLDKVISQISLLPEPQPIEKRLRLWSEPMWGGILVLLLLVYWIGRKWAGLI